MGESSTVPGSLTFQLGVLGALLTDRFAAAIADLDLKPKHVGVMVALRSGAGASQLDLARLMGVAPSLMVSLADHLESLGAIERVRDPDDRRRQILTLTEEGARLLAECAGITHALDEQLTATLTAPDRTAVRRAVRSLAAGSGFPVDGRR